ncbi:helix-turn-helix domain-containing protein [Streptomyces sp. NPDC053429]|uniref:helix-turn-helix domain-containing protein n=1 Tax=Streptomyces sp. NPDC053429 TaxID=3365702 RepID=UPI0037CFA733
MGCMTIGELIRELRTAHGGSQARLADEINTRHGTTLTREYIARWERGKVAPGGFYLAALSQVLDVPLAVLEDPTMRRTFLTDVAGTAIAPVVASDLLARGFAARLTGGPDVEEWEAKLAAYGTDYMSMGAAGIQRRVAGELVVIQQQLEQPRLWSAAARLMTPVRQDVSRQRRSCGRALVSDGGHRRRPVDRSGRAGVGAGAGGDRARLRGSLPRRRGRPRGPGPRPLRPRPRSACSTRSTANPTPLRCEATTPPPTASMPEAGGRLGESVVGQAHAPVSRMRLRVVSSVSTRAICSSKNWSVKVGGW